MGCPPPSASPSPQSGSAQPLSTSALSFLAALSAEAPTPLYSPCVLTRARTLLRRQSRPYFVSSGTLKPRTSAFVSLLSATAAAAAEGAVDSLAIASRSGPSPCLATTFSAVSGASNVSPFSEPPRATR